MVFADWLHEQGDPMAEFLTLQLEHHRKKLETLRAQRAQDLLIMNWKRWAGELSRVLHRRSCVYERGFLRVATGGVGEKSPVEAIKDAPQWATVRELTITGPGEIVGRILESPWLKNLKSLNCPAEAVTRSLSPAWSELEVLTLDEFVSVESLQLTARHVNCVAGTFDGAISSIVSWMRLAKRPSIVAVRSPDSNVVLRPELIEVALHSIDRSELRVLKQLGEHEIDLNWNGRAYRGPANALKW
jgi:hypothetical protein